MGDVPVSKKSGWEFPSDWGFTGSAGMSHVKGYVRGGPVRKGKAMKTGKVPVHGAPKGPRPEREMMAEAPAMISPPPPPKRPVPGLNRTPMFGPKK